MRYSDLRTFLLIAAFGAASFFPTVSEAGTYVVSAHGNSTYGVSRDGTAAAGFARGNCTHCHEQHASIGGNEPPPDSDTADQYMLFDNNNSTNQTTNFCFNCHGTGTGYQDGGHVVNRSYSFRAGGWTTELLNNVKDAFAPTRASSHNLNDIVKFAGDTAAQNWKYKSTVKGLGDKADADTNPCTVCHDPHVVQGDPINFNANRDNPKPGTTGRGIAITVINSIPAALFTLKLNPNFTTNYQAPYRVLNTNYEPEGDATANGTNLADYVTFCTKCHDAANIVNSSDLPSPLRVIDWSGGLNGEVHGQNNPQATNMLGGATPRPYTSGATSYVLSCLDCHEPHGSANIYLLRGKVNGNITGTISNGTQFDLICRSCHDPQPLGAGGTLRDWEDVHHDPSNPGPGGLLEPYIPQAADCSNVGSPYCHATATPPPPGAQIDCSQCHYHGAATGSGGIPPADSTVPANRKIF